MSKAVIHIRLHRRVVRLFASLLILWLSFAGSVLASDPLTQVRALVYSKTAAEIQWTRTVGQLVELSYNDSVVGILDADSYFTDDLDAFVTHQFEVRSVSAENVFSAPQVMTFTTLDFEPPTRQIESESVTLSVESASTSIANTTSVASQPAVSNVSAQVYSQSAVELFWTRTGTVFVDVIYNGQSEGRFDTSSFYKEGLSASVNHQFVINSVDVAGNTLESYVVAFSSADFAGSVQTLAAAVNQLSSSDTAVVDSTIESGSNTDTDTDTDTDIDTDTDTDTDIAAVDDSSTSSSSIQAISSGDCVVHTLSNLTDCVNAADGYDRINIRADLSCTQSTCCPTGGAVLRFDNTQSLTIEGNGYRLLREGGQRQCSLLDVTNSSSLTLRNWQLDDDSRDSPCVVGDGCPRMLHIRNSNDVTLDEVSVSNGKGYVIYVQEVNGFNFINSRLENSGVLGLYVGHSGNASTNVRIQNSVFLDNQTNALALLGVTGSSVGSNVISNNVFERNHWRGQWQVAPRFGTGYTGGGQVYIAEASGVTIRDNTISDGYCENCYVQQTFGSGVSGIEIAVPGTNSVRNVLITGNTVENHDAWGIFVNQGSTVDSSVVISNNRLIDNTVGLKASGAATSGNVIQDR